MILTFSNVAKAGGGEGNEFDAGATAFHHIADANIYSIGPFAIDLPCFLYDSDRGKWSIFSSAKFHRHGAHGDGFDKETAAHASDPKERVVCRPEKSLPYKGGCDLPRDGQAIPSQT